MISAAFTSAYVKSGVSHMPDAKKCAVSVVLLLYKDSWKSAIHSHAAGFVRLSALLDISDELQFLEAAQNSLVLLLRLLSQHGFSFSSVC